MVPVADQDQALEFYLGTLGFEKTADIPYGNGDRWVEVAPPGATTAIALVTPREGDSAGVETRIALTSRDADATHADLRAHGVDVTPRSCAWEIPCRRCSSSATRTETPS